MMNFADYAGSFISKGEEFRTLFYQLEKKTTAHAYLITGEKGVGKKTLAKTMAAAFLCSAADHRPCGCCRNCILTEKGEHPDLIILEQGKPIAAGIKKDRASIPVEDVREMIRLCNVRSSTERNMRVVLILDADKMTSQAQNCLLKTLEEPPADTCIILTTESAQSILPTVVSRCRLFRISAWNEEYVNKVLAETGVEEKRRKEAAFVSEGSIGRAIEMAADDEFWNLRKEVMDCFFSATSRSDVIRISNKWKDRKQDSNQILMILDSYVKMLAESRFGKSGKSEMDLFPTQWKKFSEKAPKEKFVKLTEAVCEARKQLQYSVNFQAVLEKIIFSFMGEGNSWL